MIKKWLVTCHGDYCDNVWITVIVEATTERKAINKAEQLLEKEGHKSIWIVGCQEFIFWEDKNEKNHIAYKALE